jgi:hypothetical protein
MFSAGGNPRKKSCLHRFSSETLRGPSARRKLGKEQDGQLSDVGANGTPCFNRHKTSIPNWVIHGLLRFDADPDQDFIIAALAPDEAHQEIKDRYGVTVCSLRPVRCDCCKGNCGIWFGIASEDMSVTATEVLPVSIRVPADIQHLLIKRLRFCVLARLRVTCRQSAQARYDRWMVLAQDSSLDLDRLCTTVRLPCTPEVQIEAADLRVSWARFWE